MAHSTKLPKAAFSNLKPQTGGIKGENEISTQPTEVAMAGARAKLAGVREARLHDSLAFIGLRVEALRNYLVG
jgi:hypothetical protein